MNKSVVNKKNSNLQKGFTIVEIMVALLLGSLVILAMTQLLITNGEGQRLQQGMTDAQEQGRFALDFIVNDARRAAYTKDINPVVGYITGTDGGSGNDSLTIRYDSSGSAASDSDRLNCLGVATALEGDEITNVYDVVDGDLRCSSGGSTQTLIGNVESFQVLYGVDTNADDVADQYVKGNAVGLNKIITIRVGVLVSGDGGGGAADVLTVTYPVLDNAITITGQQVQRLFVGTVLIRNATANLAAGGGS